MMRTSTCRLAVAAVISTGVVAAVATTPARAAPRKKGALVLTSFVQNGRTDVRRNEVLEFKFSVPLKAGSVDNRTLRVLENTNAGAKPAIGARIVRGNTVRFDATRTQRNFDESRKANSTVTEKDHTSGFTAFQDFTVELPDGSSSSHVLKSNAGARLAQPFSGSFRTNAIYDDPVAGQPTFIGDKGTGLLGFDPPKSGATSLVDADAVIVLEFSEPIDINTLDPSSSVTVLRYTVGEKVPGFIKQDPTEPSGRRFLFVPSVGFGSDLANQQGWDIQVTLSTAIQDLAGNPLKRPITFPIFRTRYVPGAASCSVVTEAFSNQAKMDPATLLRGGEWNTLQKGFLKGGAPTTYPNLDIQYTQANTPGVTVIRGNVQPFPLVATAIPPTQGGGCSAYPKGSRIQYLYTTADMGVDAAIVGAGWGPSSNATFSASYPEVTMRMGHTSLTSLGGASFDANINVGSAQLLYRGPYSVPQQKNINPPGTQNGYWEWPPFASVFEWDGTSNGLILDVGSTGGNNCQLMRKADIPAYPNRRALSTEYNTDVPFVAEPVIYDMRFRKRRRTTQAISTWYEVAADTPIFAQPNISPVGQFGGVGVLLELEGAHGKPDPFNVGSFIADPSTGTGFTPNASDIDGHRFFRFRVSMFANLNTNQTATISAIEFPYCF